MSQKINFNLDNEYTDKFNHLMNVVGAKHKVDLLKEFLDNYVVLSNDDEKALKNFITKTFYNRKDFYTEAISKHINNVIKKHNKAFVDKVYKADSRLISYIDEMIELFKNNENERMFINTNVVNKFLKENKNTSFNMSVIKRVLLTYKPIFDYHNEFKLTSSYNVEKALKKRMNKNV